MNAWREDSLQDHLDGLELLEKIGQGSVGEVWRARHRTLNSTVAVKFLMPGRLTDPWAIQALENELQTTACLHHRGIIQLLDHKHLTPDPDPDYGAHPGSIPYLVMEWIPGGSLRPARGQLCWPELRSILLQLLDALAASHAKGVIHRDIKPSNILVRDSLECRPHRVLLTDFGISQVLSQAAGFEGEVAGTPAYMAPEQLLGHLYDQGPWTDLFALACTAWALATGRPPFGGISDLAELGHAQLVLEPPPFVPSHPMPSGLEAWLRRLLRKDTQSRYTRAADACLALKSIVHLRQNGERASSSEPISRNDPSLSTTRHLPSEGTYPSNLEWSHSSLNSPALLPCLPVLCPTMPDHAPSELHPRWTPPPEMSLDLIRRRPLPVLGRDGPKEELWQALQAVHQAGRMHAVILRGPGGIGCSHLASWLCEEAHRAGVATPLLALDTPEPGGPSGLISALLRQLRFDGLDRFEREARLRGQLSRLGHPVQHDLDTLNTLLMDPHSSLIEFNLAQSLALNRLCQSMVRGPGPERPLILHLDESQWALPTLEILAEWMDQQTIRPLPMLVLLVARTQALQGRPDERLLLSRIATKDKTTDICLPPLDAATQEQLFTEALGLDEGLAEELGEHSLGNPAYAIEVVDQWIETGDLLRGPHGLTRKDPLAPIHIGRPEEIWLQRVDRALRDLSSSNRQCVEIAATLGLRLSRTDWYRACSAAGFTPSPDLVQSLVRQGIWLPTTGREPSRFAHPMWRACIEHLARVEGRMTRHHIACAQAMQGCGTENEKRIRAIARHLLASGQPSASLPYLRVAAESMLQQADLAGASQQLRRHEAVSAICTRESPEEQLAADLLRAREALMKGRPDRARALLRWSIGSAQEHGLPVPEARGRLILGRLELRAGRAMAAWRHARRGQDLLGEDPDRTLAAEQEVLLGRICLMTGRHARALLHLSQAHAWYSELEDDSPGRAVFLPLAQLALSRGRLQLAQSHLDRATAVEGLASKDPQWLMATGLLQVQILRYSGDPEGSSTLLRRLETSANPELSTSLLHLELERILVDLELGKVPWPKTIQAIRARSIHVGLGRCRTTLAALEVIAQIELGNKGLISETLEELFRARSRTGLWSGDDRRLVQRMIDTQRTSVAIPLGLLSNLESCLEPRSPHTRRPLYLGLSSGSACE